MLTTSQNITRGLLGGAGVPNFAMPIYSAAKAAGNPRILVMGTSIATGASSIGAGVWADANVISFPYLLAGLLTTAGTTVRNDNTVGDHKAAIANLTAYDPRVVFTGTWSVTTLSTNTMGGYMYETSTDGDKVSFTPSNAFDSIEVYYQVTGTVGIATTATLDIDGGATLDSWTASTGGASYAKRTTTVTLGTGTINITKTAGGGTLHITAIVAKKSTEGAMMNAGWSGAVIGNFATASSVWRPGATIDEFNPDLVILAVLANDRKGATPPTTLATFNTFTQLAITQCKAAGADVLLVIEPPSSPAVAPFEADYDAVYRTLGRSNSCNWVDIPTLWGGYAAANAAGRIMADGLHPTVQGQSDTADAIFARLQALVP